jgi:hypothetical protein
MLGPDTLGVNCDVQILELGVARRPMSTETRASTGKSGLYKELHAPAFLSGQLPGKIMFDYKQLSCTTQ